MSLFQNTVLKKYRQSQPQATLDSQWEIYRTIFHDTSKQANIRSSKEEQYQEGFLRELFVKVLGYIINPDTNFNLTTELKNLTNSKKADGAIIIDGKVMAVIELKGTDTTDLGKIEAQAFGYKTNQRDCRYVVISNFEKLRFYIDDATEFVEFNLFTLTKDEFTTLWLCLAFDNIKNDLPAKIKAESVSNEDKITKELYKDYSAFRKELFHNIVALNPQHNKLELFKKTQKLLDRFLFIFFAEDRLLLPTNLIFSINLEWQKLREARVPVSLYDRYKMYFDDLNTGARVSLPAFGKHTNEIVTAQYDIYAYNGGLFQTDTLLDTIAIDDDLLFKHTRKMSEYDFESEVDVNILGHIFENSLNEIDEIANEIEGTVIEKTKTKRKKDGVFYTPKYITKYIVDNTIGKLCTEKKTELQLDETQYTTDKRIQQKTKKDLLTKLEAYRKWLLELTIVDPACGSGAFLNQALEFLIAEHRYVDELQAKLFGDALVLSDVEGSILENNLYGVDLNEESVEIAKLSLWLRTAQRNRKLNSLNNNIKCGNSLIDDPEVAGDKAFNWQEAFPKVFAKGGFDVVIGNPPYVRSRDNMLDEFKFYFAKNYSCIHEKMNLYLLFIEKSIHLLKFNGEFGFIVPNSWLGMESGYKLREYLLENVSLNTFVNLKGESFPGVSVETVIFTLSKKIDKQNLIKYLTTNNPEINILKFYEIKQSSWLKNRSFIYDISSNSQEVQLLNKISLSSYIVEEMYDVRVGLQAYETGKGNPPQSVDDVKNHIFDYDYKFDNNTYKYFNGGDIGRYSYNWSGSWLRWGEWLSQPKDFKQFSEDRVLIREITGKFPRVLISTIVTDTCLNNKSIINILKKKDGFELKLLLGILNSTLISFFHQRMAVKGNRSLFPKAVIKDIKNYPFPKISENTKNKIIGEVDLILSLNSDLEQTSQKFKRTLQRKFELDDLPKKLQDWYLLSYAEFIKELAKKKVKLSLAQEAEWEDYFMSERKKALELKAQIDTTDKEIDRMVYELYGLTEEEILIVENSI